MKCALVTLLVHLARSYGVTLAVGRGVTFAVGRDSLDPDVRSAFPRENSSNTTGLLVLGYPVHLANGFC